MQLYRIKNKTAQGNIFECNNLDEYVKREFEVYTEEVKKLDIYEKSKELLASFIEQARNAKLDILAENIEKSYNAETELVAKQKYIIENYENCSIYNIIYNPKSNGLDEIYLHKLITKDEE